MSGNINNDEQEPKFQYSVKSNHTAEGYRIDAHVYGNNIDDLVEEWADFLQKVLDKAEEKQWPIAPMKERKSKKEIIEEYEKSLQGRSTNVI